MASAKGFQPTFSDLFINEEYQQIIKERKIYGKEQTLFEPFEVLYKWVHRDEIENFSYNWKLKDNVKAIDCIIGDKAIQLKNTKHVNKDKEIDYIKGELERINRKDLKPELICCDDELYAELLSKCEFNKSSVDLKPYQKEFIGKHLDGILSHHISIVNCFCRFGKSFLMKYIADIFGWKVSVITTKPTETAGDYQFDKYHVVSIQYLKLHPDKELEKIIFIDEPQESFMTDLTETTLDLDKFSHVVFFTGTSAVLEQYIDENYYLAHYNFGDYIQNPIPDFPKIHFHLGKSEEPEWGIRLIFDRKLTKSRGRKEAVEKGWQFQSSEDQTDIKTSEEGTYLLIGQFTTGATIPNCFVVEDRNKQFTEQDIQLIFRCFNTTDLDTPRHVYFRDVNIYKSVLLYLYRQTGKTFVNAEIIKSFFKGIVNPADINNCGFDHMRIHLDSATAKSLRKAIKKAYEEAKKRYEKSIKNILKSKHKPNHHEYRILQELKKWVETGEPDPKMTILCMRLMTGLLLSAFQEKVDMSHINEFNQDIDVMYLWTHTEDKSRVKYQFETFRFSEDDFPEKGELIEPICEGIFEVMKECVKEKFLLNVLEMIQTPLSKQKYEDMCELYPTTQIEKKTNAEILTPWEAAEEMVNACEQCGVLKPGVKCLEPCCGKGVFLTILLLRGYEVDYSDVSPANVQFCDILTGREGSVQDALTRDDYAEYDLVITNPPYNSVGENGNRIQLYPRFIKAFLSARYQCVIVPNGIFISQGNGCPKAREHLKILHKSKLLNSQTIFKIYSRFDIVYFVGEYSEEVVEEKDEREVKYQFKDRRYFVKEKYQSNVQENKLTLKPGPNSLKILVRKAMSDGTGWAYVDKAFVSHLEDVDKYKLVYDISMQGVSFKTILPPGEISGSFYQSCLFNTMEEAEAAQEELSKYDLSGLKGTINTVQRQLGLFK